MPQPVVAAINVDAIQIEAINTATRDVHKLTHFAARWPHGGRLLRGCCEWRSTATFQPGNGIGSANPR
jgi:hypothetical protein